MLWNFSDPRRLSKKRKSFKFSIWSNLNNIIYSETFEIDNITKKINKRGEERAANHKLKYSILIQVAAYNCKISKKLVDIPVQVQYN